MHSSYLVHWTLCLMHRGSSLFKRTLLQTELPPIISIIIPKCTWLWKFVSSYFQASLKGHAQPHLYNCLPGYLCIGIWVAGSILVPSRASILCKWDTEWKVQHSSQHMVDIINTENRKQKKKKNELKSGTSIHLLGQSVFLKSSGMPLHATRMAIKEK